jgi:uncharacterized surface protein with fasciclin (FAS1) repeats
MGPGPFTVLAPVNAAFAKLPSGTVANLLKPENKGALTAVPTYHVIPGKLTVEDLEKDAKGDIATIAIGDMVQSNGVIHAIDKVLLPK